MGHGSKENDIKKGRNIMDEIVARSTEGWVPEDDIFSELHDYHAIDDHETLFAMSIGVVAEILQMGLMYPVFYEGEPWRQEFKVLESWDGSVWECVAKIERAWRARLSKSSFSNIVWFGPTRKGYERGLAVLRREGWDV